MSIAAKMVMMRDLERQLGSMLTADDVQRVMQALSDQLSRYDMEAAAGSYVEGESDDYLNAFLDAKQIEGRSAKTIERYRYMLSRILGEIRVPVRDITIYHLRNYLMQMKKRGIGDSTIEGTRSIMNSFFSWLQREGMIERNPCGNINTIKCAKKIRLPFSDTEIERLKEASTGARDKALICFLLSTGCRISEVCALDRTDIDFHSMEVTVLGKGNKERTVFIDGVTAMLLKRYLASRKDTLPALFVGKGSERMTPGGIRFMLKDIEQRSGVENVHPHRFRRTLATSLINHGMPIQEVAAILGHDKLDTTMKYVYISKTNVKTAYQKYA